MSRFTTLLGSDIQFSKKKKNHKEYKETGKHDSFKKKKIN